MGLSTVAFGPEMLDIEHVAEVLVRVERAIRQMTVRALIRGLAPYTLHIVTRLVLFSCVALN